MRSLIVLFALALLVLPLAAQTGGRVVINEFSYDDSSTDNYEYVELFNTTTKDIDISGWVLDSADGNGPNNSFVIPANTIIKARSFYVIGSPLVPNVDLITTMATNIWQNSNEDIALLDTGKNIVDSLAYETNKGYWTGSREEGEGIWANGFGTQPTSRYYAMLLGRNVVPPAAGTGYGRAAVDFDTTTNKISITAQVRGFTATEVNFYSGKVGANGTLIFKLTGGPTTWTGSFTGTATNLTDLTAGDTYVAALTTALPGGIVRGQVLNSPTGSWSRRIDGLDTGNNGRDFAFRLATPGMPNEPFGPAGPTYVQTFDNLTVDTPLTGWGTSFVEPHVIDPTAVGTHNPSVIPVSPQGGKAIVVWDPAGGGDNAFLHLGGGSGDVVVECYVYLDSSLKNLNENVTWTLGIGGTTGPFYNTPDPGLGLGFTANGNTGLGWTYQQTDTATTLYLVDHGDGGWGGNARTGATVLGKIDIKKGVNDGWQRLRLERSGTKLLGTFGGTLLAGGGTCFAGTAAAPSVDWSVYVGFREAVAGVTGVRPFTADMLFVRAANSQVRSFGQGAATTQGTPTLDTLGPASIGNSCFGIRLTGLVPASQGVLLLGVTQTNPPVNLVPLGGAPGSFLYLNPLQTILVTNGATSGTAQVKLPIPANSALVGGRLYWQSFDLDPALSTGLKVGNSAGLETFIGK